MSITSVLYTMCGHRIIYRMYGHVYCMSHKKTIDLLLLILVSQLMKIQELEKKVACNSPIT